MSLFRRRRTPSFERGQLLRNTNQSNESSPWFLLKKSFHIAWFYLHYKHECIDQTSLLESITSLPELLSVLTGTFKWEVAIMFVSFRSTGAVQAHRLPKELWNSLDNLCVIDLKYTLEIHTQTLCYAVASCLWWTSDPCIPRPGRSTTEQVSAVRCIVEVSKTRQMWAFIVFIDFWLLGQHEVLLLFLIYVAIRVILYMYVMYDFHFQE